MNNENLTVTISLQRYEQLLDIETRVDVAVERIADDKYIDNEAVLRILGTELALQKADEMREESRKRDEEYRKQYEEQKNADV